ncbi:hypothetical protein [Micromonospora musae]|uniref:hypothetical protein n=1 Tax=Micromonospora musae TaxID=1894970 RepID=UPI0038992AF9
MTWPSIWTDRLGRDRTPSIPEHELAGVVSALGYGTLVSTHPGRQALAGITSSEIRQ